MTVLLLAGTAEVHEILPALVESGLTVVATAVTSYGAQILNEYAPGQVVARPLDGDGFVELMREKRVNVVVDATHPFASRVSKNAIRACKTLGVRYIRYERPACELPDHQLIFRCRDFQEAAQMAVSFGETIFLTTGSKTLDIFCEAARKAGKRLVARVLPEPGVLARCLALGLKPSDIVAMQGPFSYELNRVLLVDYGASVLVTKESGLAGGTDTKVKAALDLGIPVVLIERPGVEYPLVVRNCTELLEVLGVLAAL